MLFWVIPAVVAYMALILWIVGLLLCSMYARYSKRRAVATQPVKSVHDKSDTTNIKNKSAGQVAHNSLKKRLVKSISLYLYGLCRYYSILIGRIPSQRIRNLLMRKCLCLDVSKKAVLYGGFEMRSP